MTDFSNLLGAMLAGQAAAMAVQDRTKSIGGSDAMRIMAGDWHTLYLEKTGQATAEDLSNVFKVQLGIYTEPFHREWFAKQTAWHVSPTDGPIEHQDHPWMTANLDGWIREQKTFVELKHTRNGASVWDKARFYMPQLQHYMAVANTDFCFFSIIAGNDEPRFVEVERDQEYIENLIKMEQSFWWHVTNRDEPEHVPQGELNRIAKEGEAIKVDGLRIADMTKDNLWTDAAARFIANQQAAKDFDTAKDDLRSLIGDDVGEAYGHGITAKRDKRGRVTIKASKE